MIDDTTVAGLDELYGKAKSARARFERDWLLNLAFFENKQWLACDRTGRLFEPSTPRQRVKLVDNRIMPVIEKEVAKLTKQRPTYITTPASASDEHIEAAELAEMLLDFQWRRLGVQRRLYRALKWSRICGAGFVKTVWDPTLGDGVAVLVDPDGRPIVDSGGRPLREGQFEQDKLGALLQSLGVPPGAVRAKQLNLGDVRISVCSPWQIFPDPLADEMDDLEWLIEESVVSAERVKERYDRRIDPDADANPGMVEARFDAAPSDSGGYKGVKLREYWRRPCEAHPNGYRVVWAGGEILEREDDPFDSMPYVMFTGIMVPGRFWPMAIADFLRDPNVELNKTISQVAENRNRIGNPTLLASISAVGDQDEFERQMAVPGGVVYYSDTSNNAIPTYLEAPQMPAYVVQSIERIERSIQEIAAQHEVTSANVPTGVTAASAINLLQEADDTRLGPAATDLATQLSTMGSKQLMLAGQYYDDDRTISILGEDQAWRITPFRGQMLRGHEEVEVQEGSVFPQSRAAQQAAMHNLINTAIQNGMALRPRQMLRFVRDYRVGGLEAFVEGYIVDEAQINREHRRLTLGHPVEINSYDDDGFHVEGHHAWMKSSGYERQPDDVKTEAERHVREHQDRLAAAQQAQQEAENAAQNAQTAAQIGNQTAQTQQQLALNAERHAQQVAQAEELHQQRVQQQPTQ